MPGHVLDGDGVVSSGDECLGVAAKVVIGIPVRGIPVVGETDSTFEYDAFGGANGVGELQVIDVIEGIEEADLSDPVLDEFLEGDFDEVLVVVPESKRIGTPEEHLEFEALVPRSTIRGMADGAENGEGIVAPADSNLEALAASNFRTVKSCLGGCGDDFGKIAWFKDPVGGVERRLLAVAQGQVDQLG